MADLPQPSRPIAASTAAKGATTEEQATWAARFGWLVGAIVGTAAGFVLTWLLEMHVLKGRVHDPIGVASRASSVLVAGLFFTGALTGSAFGARGGAARYRLLGVAAGVTLAVAGWTILVVAR